jgi:hypothetical protein
MTPNPELTALNCKLIPRANEALLRVTELAQLSKTDAVNRAIQVYAFLEEQKAQGGELIIRKGDELLQVTII